MGLFVTLEGIEGSGKSSLLQALADNLVESGREIVLTREPGATEIGRAIRSILLDPQNLSLSPLAELLLFAADRAEHVDQIIRPALERGALVLCDRYTHSTLAYQGYGRGLPLEVLRQINQIATGGLAPDLVLLLDLDPLDGLARASSRHTSASNDAKCQQSESSWTRFDEQEIDFHRRIRQGFLELANSENSIFRVIDGSKRQEIVAEEALAILRNFFRESSDGKN